jgi:spore germination cell wall hydrolase CwlJ-like protein
MRVCMHALAYAAAALVLAVTLTPSKAVDLTFQLIPASLSPAVAASRVQPTLSAPTLTDEILSAYVHRQQQLQTFDGFSPPGQGELTEELLSSYIARQRNDALDAIEAIDVDLAPQPALTAALLSEYAENKFVPTTEKVQHANNERLCLTQAIYHEARGETESGQMAVANIIVNRAMNPRYPSTICGVVFQNADQGRYKCQFTFACDGRSDMGKERRAWNRAVRLAEVAFSEFQRGVTPEILPSSALFYHTTAVRPKWSYTFRRVAAIGSHIFYAAN